MDNGCCFIYCILVCIYNKVAIILPVTTQIMYITAHYNGTVDVCGSNNDTGDTTEIVTHVKICKKHACNYRNICA